MSITCVCVDWKERRESRALSSSTIRVIEYVCCDSVMETRKNLLCLSVRLELWLLLKKIGEYITPLVSYSSRCCSLPNSDLCPLSLSKTPVCVCVSLWLDHIGLSISIPLHATIFLFLRETRPGGSIAKDFSSSLSVQMETLWNTLLWLSMDG